MSKVITLDKGSKRRIKQIRWKTGEILSLALLAIFMFAIIAFAVLFEMDHEHPYSEPPTSPQVRDAQPSSP